VLHLPDRRRIYFSGDTNVFSDMQLIEKLYQPELAFLPIGDFYTMGPREAALACRLLKAKKVIPMHFGTFPALTGRPDEVARLLKDFPQTKIWPLDIGKPVEW
jgi:L-ascorbate metabolism protein UlaG (beta-lactamase superfamily)